MKIIWKMIHEPYFIETMSSSKCLSYIKNLNQMSTKWSIVSSQNNASLTCITQEVSLDLDKHSITRTLETFHLHPAYMQTVFLIHRCTRILTVTATP